MFAGRAALGPAAGHLGPRRVLAGAVAGVTLGAALMTAPGPGLAAVAAMMTVGLAAAPIFPLVTLTTADRAGAGGVTPAVGYQVAASAIGGALLPSGLGLAVGAFGAPVIAPALLILSLGCAAPARSCPGRRLPDRARRRGRPATAAAGRLPGAAYPVSRDCGTTSPVS